jgi:hypothetical protein
MPFERGKSGNPRGRPKLPPDFRVMCKSAVDGLVIKAWIGQVQRRGQHWLRCSELLAAYAYGKPTQPLTGADGAPIQVTISAQDLTDDQLAAIAAGKAKPHE